MPLGACTVNTAEGPIDRVIVCMSFYAHIEMLSHASDDHSSDSLSPVLSNIVENIKTNSNVHQTFFTANKVYNSF